MPLMSDVDKELVMHVELAITGGQILMGTDAPESMGFNLNFGNNISINVETDTLAELDILFKGLSEGGKVRTELQDMFRGAFFEAALISSE